ncbi:hypothetical protein V6N13_142176 [Hibiscus sabdariffa]|uniref:Uncharacterized protein n=1 Tax=Hibiscus sabdariffa TaxID=183260 RepID=A0ABR2FDD7_9ROSI
MIMPQSHERPISPALDVNNPASKKPKDVSFACVSLLDDGTMSKVTDDGRWQSNSSLATKEGTTRVVPLEPSKGALYGPWITVDTHRRRSSFTTNYNRGVISKNERNGVDNGSGNSANSGSRFAALLVEDGVDAQEKSLPVVDVNNKGPKDDAGSSDRHTAITLMESKYDSPGSTGGKIVKARGYVGRVSTEGHRRGLSFKKPLKVQSRSQQSLAGWLSNLSQQLELPIPDENLGADGTTGLSKFGDGHGPLVGEHTIADNEDSLQPTHSDPIGGPTSLE